MSTVERIPVQHRGRPHCPECKGELPNFDDAHISVTGETLKGAELLAVVYWIACPCGAIWGVKKNCKAPVPT